MSASESSEIFVECKGCGVENFFGDYSPGNVIVCNQCRDRLVDADIDDTHNAFVCDDCGLTLFLLKETEVIPGESTCRCGGASLSEIEISDVASDYVSFPDNEDEDDEPLEDTDWLREGSANPDDDDYNDMFNQDPSTA